MKESEVGGAGRIWKEIERSSRGRRESPRRLLGVRSWVREVLAMLVTCNLKRFLYRFEAEDKTDNQSFFANVRSCSVFSSFLSLCQRFVCCQYMFMRTSAVWL